MLFLDREACSLLICRASERAQKPGKLDFCSVLFLLGEAGAQSALADVSVLQVSLAARRLIRGLLERDPNKRLGATKGATELKAHPFFEGLNWPLIRFGVSAQSRAAIFALFSRYLSVCKFRRIVCLRSVEVLRSYRECSLLVTKGPAYKVSWKDVFNEGSGATD